MKHVFKDLIGLENTPNIYISQVLVSDDSEKAKNVGTKVNVELLYHNMLGDSNEPVWNEKIKNKDAYIEMLCVYNSTMFNTLLSTQTMNQEREIIRQGEMRGTIKVHKLSTNKRAFLNLKRNKPTPIYVKKEIVLDTNIKDLYILVRFKGPIYSSSAQAGPTVAEAIMQNGRIVNSSYVFKQRNSNKIWTGPVHKHQNVFMAGSHHKTTPHSKLVKVESENYKVKDLRKLKEPTSLPDSSHSRVRNENNYFSEIKYSQNIDRALNFMFSINTKEMFVNSSKHASILKQYDEVLFNSMAQQTTIKSLYLYYRRPNQSTTYIIDSKDVNGLIQPAQVYRDSLTKTPRKTNSPEPSETPYSNLKELVFDQDPNIRTFSCQIHEKTVSTIKVLAEVSDPLESYLYTLLQQAKEQGVRIKNYSSLLRRRDVFDRDTGRLKKRKVADRYDDRRDLWYRPLETYMRIKTLVYKMSKEQANDEVKKCFEMVAPRSCTIQTVDMFVDAFSKTLSLFILKYSLRSTQANLSTPSGNSSGTPRRYTYEKEYDIYYKADNQAYSCMNLSTESNMTPVMTIDQFQNVLATERQKFLNTLSRYDQNTKAPPNVVASANSDEYENYFLTPTHLYNYSSKIKFSDISLLEEDKISEFVESDLLDSLNIKDLFGRGISVKVYEEEEPVDTSVNPLGTESNFHTTSGDHQRQIDNLTIPKNLRKALGSQNNNSFPLFNKLDVTTNKNFLSSKTTHDAERIPMQHKFLSNANQMNSLFSSTKEFINNKPYTNELAFFNIQKIMFEQRYDRDSGDNLILGKTIKQEMSNTAVENITKPILCYLANYEDQSLIKGNNFLENYSKINSFFIVVPNMYKFEKIRTMNVYPYSVALSNAYKKYVSTSLYENMFLRNSFYQETAERKNIPSIWGNTSRQKGSRLAARAQQRRESRAQRAAMSERDRYEKNEEKLRTMAEKTITEDNRTAEQLLRSEEPERRERLSSDQDSRQDNNTRNTNRTTTRENNNRRNRNNTGRNRNNNARNRTSSSRNRSRGGRSGY